MEDDEDEGVDYNWPLRLENGLNIRGMIKQQTFQLNPLVLPSTLVQYLLIVCDRLKISVACIQLTLSLLSRYLKKRPNAFPLQLVMMTCLFVSSKLLQTNHPQLNQLHKWSCNSFTSKDFYRVQKSILIEMDFNILSDGVPDIQIKLVGNCVKSLLEDDQGRILLSVLQDLQKVVWSYIYCGKIKMKQGRDKTLTSALLHLSLVLLTQYSGKFLQSIWACQLTDTTYKQASSLSSRILKQILGEAKCKIYKL